MKTILKRIRALRERKGIRAKDVAEAIGISRPYYTLIESGNRRLTAEQVSKIAAVLGVSVGELYGEGRAKDGRRSNYLQPINTPELREKLRPILGDRTEDAVDCLQAWFGAPAKVKLALRALCEIEEG